MANADPPARPASDSPARRRRIWLAACILLALAVFAALVYLGYARSLEPEGRVPVLLTQLRAGERTNWFIELLRRLALLEHEQSPGKHEIVQELVAIGPEAVPPLIEALKDRAQIVREAAAEALGCSHCAART
jgi:hypothetical protein